jgi:hypothetical protein
MDEWDGRLIFNLTLTYKMIKFCFLPSYKSKPICVVNFCFTLLVQSTESAWKIKKKKLLKKRLFRRSAVRNLSLYQPILPLF